jgi:hypothetical protein
MSRCLERKSIKSEGCGCVSVQEGRRNEKSETKQGQDPFQHNISRDRSIVVPGSAVVGVDGGMAQLDRSPQTIRRTFAGQPGGPALAPADVYWRKGRLLEEPSWGELRTMEFDLVPLRVLRGLFNSGVVLVLGFGVVLSVGALRDERAMVAVADVAKLNGTERQHVIDGVITNLKAHYVDKDVAQKMADALLAHEKKGDDNAIAEGWAFADLLTSQMREVSHDMHLEVVYSRERLPEHPGVPSAESAANYRMALERENCTFEAVRVLPHNIGYLKLSSFPDVSICRSTAVSAMASLNRADAVIFDLRDNRGGDPEMVMLIAAYLFDHPEYMYSPRESPTERSWTRSPIAGNRLANKPVYVLISGTTWSAAEQFSYDLKMLKRATLVGERTRGGAHAGVFYRIDDHFGVGIPEVRAVSPFGKNDWAGVGVEPDVKVKAADALATAERLAEGRLR